MWPSASGTPTALDARSARSGRPGMGTGLPNRAGQPQTRGVASLATASSPARDPLKSTTQESAEAQAPGLPDFAHGA